MTILTKRKEERMDQTSSFFGTDAHDFCPYCTGKHLLVLAYPIAKGVTMKTLIYISFVMFIHICVRSIPRGGVVW
jgi:hypothetical protein